MNTKHRTRKLVVTVSNGAYQALQTEAVRTDWHATNVAYEVVESALLALAYPSNEEIDQIGGEQ